MTKKPWSQYCRQLEWFVDPLLHEHLGFTTSTTGSIFGKTCVWWFDILWTILGMLLGILHPPLPGTSEAARWRKKQKQNPWGSVPCWELNRGFIQVPILGCRNLPMCIFLNCKVPLWHLTLVSSFLEVQTSSCIFRTTGLLNAEWSTALPDPFTFASLRQLGMLWTLIQFYLDSFDWLEFSDDFNTITGSPHDRSSARKPQWNLDSRRNYPRIFIC